MKDNTEIEEPKIAYLIIAILASCGLFGLGYFIIWLILALAGGR